MAIERAKAHFGEGSENEVVIEKEFPEVASPARITRLGKPKLEFLTNIAGIKPTDRLLELFGGSNLSTAIFSAKRPKSFVSIDIRYAPHRGVEWSYKTAINFPEARKEIKVRKTSKPRFVAADAARLPLKERAFTLVLAPDSPRTVAERFLKPEKGQNYIAGAESGLMPEEQEQLFLTASQEAYRVLERGGRYVGTAPINWARQLRDMAFSEVLFWGSKEIGDDVQETKEYGRSKNVQFKTEGMRNPIVYFRCIK
jgi:hypothetical protein